MRKKCVNTCRNYAFIRRHKRHSSQFFTWIESLFGEGFVDKLCNAGEFSPPIVLWFMIIWALQVEVWRFIAGLGTKIRQILKIDSSKYLWGGLWIKMDCDCLPKWQQFKCQQNTNVLQPVFASTANITTAIKPQARYLKIVIFIEYCQVHWFLLTFSGETSKWYMKSTQSDVREGRGCQSNKCQQLNPAALAAQTAQTKQIEVLRVISRPSLRFPGLGPSSEYFLATSTRYLDEIACRIY